MDDLISRQNLIVDLTVTAEETAQMKAGDLKKVINVINNQPSAQQWIPCSERLPDQNGKYLVVGRQKAINILKFDGGRWYGKWGVVAWMPLPSPYREEATDG